MLLNTGRCHRVAFHSTPGTELEHMDQSVKLKAPKSLLRKVVVVTGGAGYLGQRITYQFLAARVGSRERA